MTKKLFQFFIQPHQDIWQNVKSLSQVLSATTLAEFEKAYFELAGFEDLTATHKPLTQFMCLRMSKFH